MTTRRATIVIASAVAAGLIGGAGAMAWADSTDDSSSRVTANTGEPVPTPPMPTAPPQAGQHLTIGAWQKDKPAPDLVPVDLKNGISGFLRTYDLAYGDQNAAFIHQLGDGSTETVLPVYAEDGQTVIGEFDAGTTTSH